MTYHARVIDDRQVILPEDLAAELGLQAGGSLTIEREEGKLVLKTFDQVVREAQIKFREMLPPGFSASLADELIADRRAEIRRDDSVDNNGVRQQRAG